MTLAEDIESLDRMVDGNADKSRIQSQIRLIGREVATLEADNTKLAEDNEKLKEVLAKYKARDDSEAADAARRAQDVYLDRE
jgi:hypothetical protein